MDQRYLNKDQKKALGVDPEIDYYTAETCERLGCTATRLDSTNNPLSEDKRPLVDVDAYKFSLTGEI
jgi:hypothetical protein